MLTVHSLSNPRAQLLLAACSQFAVHSPVHKCCTSRALDRGSGCAPQAQRPGPSSGWRRAVTANAHAAKRSKPVRSMLTSAVSSRAARSLQQHDARLTHLGSTALSSISLLFTCPTQVPGPEKPFCHEFYFFPAVQSDIAPMAKKVR